MGKKHRQQNNSLDEEEEVFVDPRQGRREKRRNRRKAKNRFDNAMTSVRYGYNEELEGLEYDDDGNVHLDEDLWYDDGF